MRIAMDISETGKAVEIGNSMKGENGITVVDSLGIRVGNKVATLAGTKVEKLVVSMVVDVINIGIRVETKIET